MSLADTFRRLFSPSTEEPGTVDTAEEASDAVVTGGPPGFAGLEVAEAAEDAAKSSDAPPDPAP
jgi:hypothetical protein